MDTSVVFNSALALPDATRILAPGRERWDPYELPYQLPEQPHDLSAKLAEMAESLAVWTGWSNRALADVIGTTHPTVAAIKRGERDEVTMRNADAVRRLGDLYALTSRLAVIVRGDRAKLRTALELGTDGPSALEYVAGGRVDDAYLTAIRALRPNDTGRLVRGSRPMSPHGRIIDPFDKR